MEGWVASECGVKASRVAPGEWGQWRLSIMGCPWASTDDRLLKRGGVFSMRLRREAVSLGSVFVSNVNIL